MHAPLPLGLLLGSQLAGFEPAAIVGGIVLGAFSESRPCWQSICVALLYWGTTRIILLVRKKCRPSVRFLIFVLCMLASLPVSAIYGTEELLYGLISLSVSVLSAMFFRRVCLMIKTMNRARIVTDAEQGAVILGIGSLVLATADASFLGWSLPVSLILLLTAIAVFLRGVFGAAAGIFWSVMLTLYAGSDPAFVGAVAIGALLASALREKGKRFIALAFILPGLLFRSFFLQQAYGISVPNYICGMLLFLIMPKDWLMYLREFVDPRRRSDAAAADAAKKAERRTSFELERMGKLLGGFSGTFRAEPETDDTVERWTVQGALAICRGCDSRPLCWRNADEMRDTVLTIAKAADRGNRVLPLEPVDESCVRFSDLCASILLAYRQAQNRNAVSRQALAQMGFAERQLSGAGETLCAYAKRMRARVRDTGILERNIKNRLIEAGYDPESLDIYETDGSEMISVQIRRPLKAGHAAVQREIEQACGFSLRCVRVSQNTKRVSFGFEPDAILHAEAQISQTAEDSTVSGDATGECRIPGGRVCFALSDGMGSGTAARRESEAAIRLLFRLYRAGVKKELVYENVNRMLLAQNETETYATLDAISIDLNTGEAELLKYGAPPSFLLRDGQVSVIAGEAFPCGILADAKPSVIRLQLKRNDRIVLCSDGVQDVLPEGTEKAIQAAETRTRKTGEALLRVAKAHGGSDDMTVMVIRVA